MHPYKSKPDKSFWSKSVSKKHFYELDNLWIPIMFDNQTKIATGGSCFAQHIGRALIERGANFMDLETKPEFIKTSEMTKWGYGLYSCRYGNIYTARQLLQLFYEAFDKRKPADYIWEKEGNFFDALRPSIEPIGHSSKSEIKELRSAHLGRVKKMFEDLDIFVFTLGLTESWVNKQDETVYPTAPGVICGEFDKEKYYYKNFSYTEVYSDLKIFINELQKINKGARIILTVSPVPLAATASKDHVLVASSYSKSVLRSVAGDLSTRFDSVIYFPSYEIVSSHVGKGFFYEKDLRSVNQKGVEYVMSHFFSNSNIPKEEFEGNGKFELICDENKHDQTK